MSDQTTVQKQIAKLVLVFKQAIASINVLFREPRPEGSSSIDAEFAPFVVHYQRFLQCAIKDLNQLLTDSSTADRKFFVLDDQLDSVDCLNVLVELSEGRSFADILQESVCDSLTAGQLFEEFDINDQHCFAYQDLLFKTRHADNLVRQGLRGVREFLSILDGMAGRKKGLSRLNPALYLLVEPSKNFYLRTKVLREADFVKLQNLASENDLFSSGQAFRYVDNEFMPVNLNSIRSIKNFYGYNETRDRFRRFFSRFASGVSNHPLLITSLPGLGKTHISIASTLAHENLTLILPEPSDLEGKLETLVRNLARRKNNRFVIFFDDVDTRNIDWYYFRTHVGGSFILPPNVTIVIASNYEFPANISSRGQGLTFPLFDEIVCQEMIRDFIASFGMKNPKDELISVIAADYVEEFGQKVFEELSPRTLVRYLERYNNDLEKRKRMLNLSREEIISRPDPQIFYEENVRLLRSLYGEEAILRLRNEKFDIYDDEPI